MHSEVPGRKRRRSASGGTDAIAWRGDATAAQRSGEREENIDEREQMLDLPPAADSESELQATAERLARAKLRDKALGYLARREHSAHELIDKLSRKDEFGFSAEIVEQLGAEDLQSDERYAHHLGRVRTGSGKGPMVLHKEFQQHRIDAIIVETVMSEYDGCWEDFAERARIRKFGEELPSDYKEWARQARFLQQRGFSSQHIRRQDRS